MQMVDGAERLRALTELDSCLLVEAAAGTGKTSLLAGRVVMLLAHGIDPRLIAAITFTELAAGELRHRIASYLHRILEGRIPDELRPALPSGPDAAQTTMLRGAAKRLDELTCGTIHSFCHDLLKTYSVEAAIDPGADVLDGDQADFVFDAIFDRWWRGRLDRTASAAGDPIASVARRDPIDAEGLLRSFAKFRRRHRGARPLPADLDAQADVEFAESVREFRRWCDQVDVPPEADPDIVALETLVSHFRGRFDPMPDFEGLLELAHPAWLPIMRKDTSDLREYRRRTLWRKAGGAAGERLADQAEEHFGRCRRVYGALMGRIATAIIGIFSAELDEVMTEYETFKRRAAVLDFDDLLFTCRDVLRDHPSVRTTAAERFSRLLVDEFQDTDPVQAEIIFLLCGTAEDDRTWHARSLRPGHLFVVGDPKQAIYRFRGADLATYLRVRETIEAQFPDNILRVTANFRSRGQILDHVNRCFEERLSSQQAGYVALQTTRAAGEHGLPCVAKVSVELPPLTRVDSARDEEAQAVAEVCSRLIGNVDIKLNDGETRRLCPGDIALLAPVSTDLWRYERALEEAGLPFASQAGKNLYKRQEAQDLVALIRALADTRDTLALGALMRGPLVGLTEQELLDITADLPVDGDRIAGLSLRTEPAAVRNPVAREVLTVLTDLRRRINATAPAFVLAEAIERLRIRAIVAARSGEQAARALANVDGFVERARSYDVRGFVQFARDIDDEWSSGSASPEGMMEADGQSIEIVTVHSSKGLEWPVVIPINRSSMPRRAEAFVHRRRDESLHWALGQVVPPGLGDALRTEEAEKRDENVRLLYVACTRAMELLVIPDFSWSNDASWAKLLDFKLETVPELDIGRLPRTPVASRVPVANGQTAQIFAEERSRIEAAPRVRWIKPSDSDPDVITDELSFETGEELPRAETTVEGGRIRGILLHKLMEELISGELEENQEAATARSNELFDQLSSMAPTLSAIDVRELASTALRTLRLPDVDRYRGRLVAEVPVYGTAAGPDDLVGGRADAIARDDEGTIVFDWKSDVDPKEADFSAYRRQLGHYLRATGSTRGAIVYMTSGHVDWVGLAG
ncbi:MULTISPECIES: UvrD-helicase domain-containing protein [Bradyrhizobium]|jgi:CRISPR-associated exonuclease Cas4|uniref:DNA 3'-5' helicase n=5 Tax=Bradyrhizobium elkanii TaxID=29448 RepID=A0ABV4EQA0_BRAEL|nr:MULTISPECIES: UvrD-helicase domain-containing protein [Bradyrhizobium]MCP1758711.1 CRISPR-associated exonuclease Cas4 [Bradyrhizobium elkanii]MCP1975730.1 CRISPR-associated exonuclease Cas4 [Bradyrhizobium elkanii]MCP1984908.1 CRISPR-associated exonuclease Cas4 [Bradyrhizobium elkanii]MCS3890738.1 CRISPR-associated exonuclease Cas4 [Bradyrhizobium elkanii]MCS4113078.1 CRISPR-associated exonuclease Cas4 [Bradyrhizobium elkanii]